MNTTNKRKRMTDLVVVDYSGRFWIGLTWGDEYPDAVLFDHLPSERMRRAMLKDAIGGIQLVVHYGLNNQKILLKQDKQ